MAHALGEIGNAYSFTTPVEQDVGIGHEFCKTLVAEGCYRAVADTVWLILKDWVDWYDNPYREKFSGVDWHRSDVRRVTQLYLQEKEVHGISADVAVRTTGWERFAAAACSGEGMAMQLFLGWAGISFPYSLTNLAKARDLEKELGVARAAVRRISLAYYEMLRYDGWMEDNHVPWIPDNWVRPDGSRPIRVDVDDLFRNTTPLLSDYDVDAPILLVDVLDRLDVILWEQVDRHLTYGFIVKKMQIVDTSESLPGGEAA